ncbi:MAG: cyclic nucleotide-binding domain-containing protein [Ignavibacteriae bacterium]|nr:cyclic nucleotide-binding domain-containing protein [Ignavibacteriota bacterium]
MKSTQTVVNKVRNNALFESVEQSLLNHVLEQMQEHAFHGGDLIFEDESEGDCVYLILSGTVSISKKTQSGEETILTILHEGDFFGELELIDGCARSAQAVAMTDCVMASLGKDHFNLLLESSEQFKLNLLRKLSLRLQTSNILFIHHLQLSLEQVKNQLDKMHKIVEAAKSVNSSLDLNELLGIILKVATTTTNADGGTLYLVDKSKNELWSKVQQGSTVVEIHLPLGKGIAGYVASSGATVNIPNAYADSRFNPEVDQLTGYRTRTILCMPMKNKDGDIIGVFQLLNKEHDPFTIEDEEFIETLSIHASLAIENARLAQEMIQNERLSAVGRMASTIIHDIKNPMGTLRVYAEVMKSKTEDKETAKLADEMMHQVDRFVTMTQEILDFSRGVSSMNVQEVTFDDMMETILNFIDKDLKKRKVHLVKKLKFIGKVKVDPDKLMRAFYNIASNAADAMPKGGQLTIRTEQKNGSVLVEFVDTGTGMPAEIRNKIFEPFVTYGKKHGTGLGMAIVKKIIDDHKGTIEIESEPGSGTTVRLSLPLN